MHAHGSAASQHRGRLATVLALVIALLVVEVVVAMQTGSLALLSDAGHLATDVVGLSLALAAVLTAASRAATSATSFGWHRLEILAALANAMLLLGVAGFVLYGAIVRIGAPVHVEPMPLLVVALVALTINLVSAWLLRPGAQESLNLEGARLEVLADAVGSIGVLVTAIGLQITGWAVLDSIVGLAIALWLVPRALKLAQKSLRVLLQHAPEHVDVDDLQQQLEAVASVAAIHDLHVWTLTSGMDVASAHVRVADGADPHDAQHEVQTVLTAAGLAHATVQVESYDDCCAGHPAW